MMEEIFLVILALLIFAGSAYAVVKGSNMDTAQMKQWDSYCKSAADITANLDPWEIKAVIAIESSGNPNSQNPSDPSYGLMGVTMPIGSQYGAAATPQDLLDPQTNISAGSGFLDYLKGRYAAQYPLGQGAGWIQMYNLGETKFLKGERDSSYESKFIEYSALFQPDFGS